MKKIILSGREGRPSIKSLFESIAQKTSDVSLALRVKGNVKKKIFNDRVKEYKGNLNKSSFHNKGVMDASNSILIRWGTRQDAITTNAVTYNVSEALKKASNKKLTRQLLEAGEVRIPRLFNSTTDNITYPVIARPLSHSKGKDFVVLNTFEEFEPFFNSHRSWYYSEFINKTREFRVHCGHGKILGIMEKPKGEGVAWNRVLNDEPFTRVLQEDYSFNVCKESLKAIAVLGLDFGGVDVMVEGDNIYILEVNTCPSVVNSTYIHQRYMEYFEWLLSSTTRRDHWDFNAFTKATSFAWKNNQFI